MSNDKTHWGRFRSIITDLEWISGDKGAFYAQIPVNWQRANSALERLSPAITVKNVAAYS